MKIYRAFIRGIADKTIQHIVVDNEFLTSVHALSIQDYMEFHNCLRAAQNLHITINASIIDFATTAESLNHFLQIAVCVAKNNSWQVSLQNDDEFAELVQRSKVTPAFAKQVEALLQALTFSPRPADLAELLNIRLQLLAEFFARDTQLFLPELATFSLKNYALSFPELLAIASKHPYLCRELDRALPYLKPLATAAEKQTLLANRLAFAQQAEDSFAEIDFGNYDLSYQQLLYYLAMFPSFDREAVVAWVQTHEKELDNQQRFVLVNAMLQDREITLKKDALTAFDLTLSQEQEIVMELLRRNAETEEPFYIDPSYMCKVPFTLRLQSFLAAVKNCSLKFVWIEQFCLTSAQADAMQEQSKQGVDQVLLNKLILLIKQYASKTLELVDKDFVAFKAQSASILAEFNQNLVVALHGHHILTGCFNKLVNAHKHAEERDDAMALINMAVWLFHTSLCFLDASNGLGVARFAAISAKFPLHSKVLQEIYNLAAPQYRFHLTTIYLACAASEDASSLLQELVHKQSNRAVLPALLLADMLVTSSAHLDQTEKEQAKKQAVGLLKQIPGAYDEGVNLRTLVQGLAVICATSVLTLPRKFAIIERCFTKYELTYLEIKPEDNFALHTAKWKHQSNLGNKFLLIRQGQDFYFSGFAKDGSLIQGNLQNIPDLHKLSVLLAAMLAKGTRIINAKNDILNLIAAAQTFGTAMQRQLEQWLLCTGLAGRTELHGLEAVDLTEKKLFYQLFLQCLTNTFNLSAKQLAQYKKKFAKYDKQTALLAYHAKLSALPMRERDVYLNLLKSYVHAICSRFDYYRLRYNPAHNKHLQAVFANRELMQNWIYGASADLNTVIATLPVMDSAQVITQAIQLIRDSILIKKLLPQTCFPEIYLYLTARDANDRVKIQQNLAANANPVARIQAKIIQILERAQNFSVRVLIKHLEQLAVLCQNDLRTSILSRDFGKFLQATMSNLQLVNENRKVTSSNCATYTVVDTDHPKIMLKLGTDVEGSCQSVNGNPRLNKCLIGGYILSGHVRVIAIVDANGNIIARNILRLMVDEVTGKPVLFLEEIYPATAPAIYRQAIVQFASMRALQLGCVLLAGRSENLDAVEHPNPIKTLQVNAAEYVDAIGGPQTSSYTIFDSKVIFDPVRYKQQLSLIQARKTLDFSEPVASRLRYLQQGWHSNWIQKIYWQQGNSDGTFYPASIQLSSGAVIKYSTDKSVFLRTERTVTDKLRVSFPAKHMQK